MQKDGKCKALKNWKFLVKRMLHCFGRGQLLLSTVGLVFTIVCTKKILTPSASETHIFMTVIGTVMRPRTIHDSEAFDSCSNYFPMCLSISCVNIQSETSIFQKKTSFYRLAESQFHTKTFTKLYRFCDAFFFYCASLCIFEVKIPCVTQSIYRTPHTRTAREAMKIKRVSKLLESAYAANKSTLIYFPEAYWRLQQRVPLPPFFLHVWINRSNVYKLG